MAIRKPASSKPPRERAKRKPRTPLWQTIVEIGNQIPDEEIAKFPRDGAERLDEYLHGPEQPA
jgi:hypothetical protein